MPGLEDVGAVIHVLRVVRGLSQGDLAKVSGVRNSSISNYERGKSVPKLETLQKLAEGLSLPLSAIEETQRFIWRMRGAGDFGSDEEPDGLSFGDGSGLEAVESAELRGMIERLASEAGGFSERLVRTVLLLLAKP